LDYVNQVLTRYSGRTVEGVLGNAWAELIHPEDLDEALWRWRDSVRTGELYEAEYRLRRADGAFRWFLTRATCMREPDGRPLKWFGTATDIDDARRSREAHRFLAEASALLGSSLDAEATLQQVARLAVPTLADWCCVDMLEEDGSLRRLAVSHTDPAKVRLAWEIARRYTLNLEAEHGVPHVLRTGEASWVPDVTEDMLVAATGGDPERLGMARQLGLRSFLAVPLVARGRLLGVLILAHSESGRRYDESDVRLAEDLGRRAGLAVDNARLYAASQTAVRLRDDFLGVASHELKTPLTPILLKVQALQRRVNAEPDGVLPARQVGAMLDAVGAQTRKLSVLVSGLLDVSRISTGRLELRLEPVDLAALMREVAHAFEPEAAKADCALRLRLTEAPVVGQWDRLRLEQVVTNLLANALKYGAGRPVEVTLATADGRALLGVRDEGIGIAAEAQARIFEKFERAVSDRHYGGLGLGLYITREIVRALGGSVSVESEPERGALFTVSLPLGTRADVNPCPS
jgi:PAS domain S-box-containing protein